MNKDPDALSVVASWFAKQMKANDAAGKEDCMAAARLLINYLFKHGYRVLPIKGDA